MYIRKDIQKSLKSEAAMAERSHCFSWATLFRECAFLLRKKDRKIERLRAFAQEVIRYADTVGDEYLADMARAALEEKA